MNRRIVSKERRGSERRERIRQRTTHERTKQGSRELNDILASIKKNTASFSSKMDDLNLSVPTDPLKPTKPAPSSHRLSINEIKHQRTISHERRTKHVNKYVNLIQKNHMLQRIDSTEEFHLSNLIRKKDFDGIDLYLQQANDRHDNPHLLKTKRNIIDESRSKLSAPIHSPTDSYIFNGMSWLNDADIETFENSAIEILLVLRNTGLKAWLETTCLKNHGGDMLKVPTSVHIGR
jgi:hypothetical protein